MTYDRKKCSGGIIDQQLTIFSLEKDSLDGQKYSKTDP